jgi:hypothetical protein
MRPVRPVLGLAGLLLVGSEDREKSLTDLPVSTAVTSLSIVYLPWGHHPGDLLLPLLLASSVKTQIF